MVDFIYGLGNTISGAVFLTKGRTPSPTSEPDTACLVSGWFSQSNAQAVDFNILIISIVVLLSIVKKDAVAQLQTKWQVLICIAAWIPGFITGKISPLHRKPGFHDTSNPADRNLAGTIGLTLNSYGYVSGNWCWVKRGRLDLRYGLSHGPRIAIFVITIAIYTYIYLTLKRVFKTLRSVTATTDTRTAHDNPMPGQSDQDNDQKILIAHSVLVSHELQDMPRTPDAGEGSDGFNSAEPTTHSTVTVQGTAGNDSTRFENSRMPAAPNLKKMLLMNGYPLAYIILWIPGIANRLAESVGQSPRWLNALQASTQYIGLVNAVTYGMSEQMRQGVWKKLKDPGGRNRG